MSGPVLEAHLKHWENIGLKKCRVEQGRISRGLVILHVSDVVLAIADGSMQLKCFSLPLFLWTSTFYIQPMNEFQCTAPRKFLVTDTKASGDSQSSGENWPSSSETNFPTALCKVIFQTLTIMYPFQSSTLFPLVWFYPTNNHLFWAAVKGHWATSAGVIPLYLGCNFFFFFSISLCGKCW